MLLLPFPRAILPGGREKLQRTGCERHWNTHPRDISGLGIWETASNTFLVGFQGVEGMRKERREVEAV